MKPDAASPVVQPLQPPLLRSEVRQLLTSGVLIDRAGQPVPGLPCPSCPATAGKRCKRPSGHTAETWHIARVRAAEAVDDQREAEGDPTLLAPWPE